MAPTTKRVIAAVCGLLYAFLYGLWTMLLTGGGHGNFIWFEMFLSIDFMGLYFPLMAVLSIGLRSTLSKMIFGLLISFNLIASAIMLYGWINEVGENGKPSDFSRMVQISGIDDIVFAAVAHFLPTLIFLLVLIYSVYFGQSLPDEETTTLNLS